MEFYKMPILNFSNCVNCGNKIVKSCICWKTLSEKTNKEKKIIHWELYVEKMYSAAWWKNVGNWAIILRELAILSQQPADYMWIC